MFVGLCVGVEDGSDILVFVVGVECSAVLFFIGRSKYAGFSLSMDIVSFLTFIVSVKYLGCLSFTWKGSE